MSTQADRDRELAEVAKRHGANFSLRIIREARRAGIPVSLGFALVEQESDFSNVFGHDETIFAGAGLVTKAKYLKYKAQRGSTGRGGMQGVGPCQLTWYEFQDKADHYGGCWLVQHNIRVAFEHLAGLIAERGEHHGLAAYNGTGPAAQEYARSVRRRQEKWHQLLS